MTSPANSSDRETGTVERLVARAECMNGAMKAGGLYLRLGDYTDEDAALDREAASELTRLKARADAAEAGKDRWFETHLAHRAACDALGKANGELFKRAYEAEKRAESAEAKLATAREALPDAIHAMLCAGSMLAQDDPYRAMLLASVDRLHSIIEGADHERS